MCLCGVCGCICVGFVGVFVWGLWVCLCGVCGCVCVGFVVVFVWDFVLCASRGIGFVGRMLHV